MDRPIFLGVCSRTIIHGEGIQQDFLNVSPFSFAHFFPHDLKTLKLLFCFPLSEALADDDWRVVIEDEANTNRSSWVKLSLDRLNDNKGFARIDGHSRHWDGELQGTSPETLRCNPVLTAPAAAYFLYPVPCPPLVIPEPTTIRVKIRISGTEYFLGAFTCALLEPPPLSNEEIAAIKGRPGSIKALQFHVSCTGCHDQYSLWTALTNEFRSHPPANATWLSDAPNEWTCRCRQTTLPLLYLKRGLHQLFRVASLDSLGALPNANRLYDRSAISEIRETYQQLIHAEPDEEVVQEFLEANPLIWGFLSPVKIWYKPAVSTKYKADFAVLSASRILHLIEIEKPSTSLARQKTGGVHSEFQRGLDQLAEWKEYLANFALAFYDSLPLRREDVHDVRYVYVAGLATKTKANELNKIRKNLASDVAFYCFDELSSFLYAIESAVRNL